MFRERASVIYTNLASHEGKQHVISCTNLFRIDGFSTNSHQQVIHDLQSLQTNNITRLLESESLRLRTPPTFPQ